MTWARFRLGPIAVRVGAADPRRGRAGRAGTAVSFLTAEDQDIFYDLRVGLAQLLHSIYP
jgi:superfamily II DNA/RNA helicase